MLIQSVQYVEEQGEDFRNIALYGQEASGTTLGDLQNEYDFAQYPSATIENGDTLQDPLIQETVATWKKFDIVIANPPFSQNYNKSHHEIPNGFLMALHPKLAKSRPDVCAAHGGKV